MVGKTLDSQQILKLETYCDQEAAHVTLKMMNIVPPLNIQKKDIRLKKMTSKEPFLSNTNTSFLCIDRNTTFSPTRGVKRPNFPLCLSLFDNVSLTLVSVTTPQKESWAEGRGYKKRAICEGVIRPRITTKTPGP